MEYEQTDLVLKGHSVLLEDDQLYQQRQTIGKAEPVLAMTRRSKSHGKMKGLAA